MLDVIAKRIKILSQKNTEKRTVALPTDFQTLIYLQFYIGASFTVLLMVRRLEKMSNINVKRMKNVHSKKHEKRSVAPEKPGVAHFKFHEFYSLNTVRR